MTNLTTEILEALRGAAESFDTDTDGTRWGTVYLDNCRGDETVRQFRACLAALSRKGLYKPQDGFAFGSVKMEEAA